MRINCAHDNADAWAAMIENTRKAGDAVGRRMRVLMDLAGPKIRIGEVRRQPGERLPPTTLPPRGRCLHIRGRCDAGGGVRAGRCAGPLTIGTEVVVR